MAWPVFLSGPGPGPGGSWPESGGEPDGPGFADVFAAGPGGSVTGDEGTLLMRGAFDSIAVEPEALSQEPVTALRVVVFAGRTRLGCWTCWTLLMHMVRVRNGGIRVWMGSYSSPIFWA